MALIYSTRRAAATAVLPHWKERAWATSADKAAIAGVAMMLVFFVCAVAATVLFLSP